MYVLTFYWSEDEEMKAGTNVYAFVPKTPLLTGFGL